MLESDGKCSGTHLNRVSIGGVNGNKNIEQEL